MAKKISEKPTTDKELIIKIHDFEIYTNSLYEVDSKKDPSAPDGFIKHNTTKTLDFKVQDELNLGLFCGFSQLWDAGLSENSTALKRAFVDPSARALAIQSLEKHIIEPYRNLYGQDKLDTRPDTKNNDFWDNLSTKVYKGKVFNTANLKDLFELYTLIVHRKLTPQGKESSHEFKSTSAYVIVNKERLVSAKVKKTLSKFEAFSKLNSIIELDEDKAKLILDFAGLSSNSSTDKASLIIAFEEWIMDPVNGETHIERFLEAVTMATDKKGEQVLDVFKKLKEIFKSNSGKVKLRNGVVYLNDSQLAKGFKESAYLVFEDKELLTIIYS